MKMPPTNSEFPEIKINAGKYTLQAVLFTLRQPGNFRREIKYYLPAA